MQPDPTAVKPDDWDESEPEEIPDPDPDVRKPDDWDESIAPKQALPNPEWSPKSESPERDSTTLFARCGAKAS